VKNLGKNSYMASFSKKKMDGCVSWMKREGLHTSRVVRREKPNTGYVK